jgi:serine/threonine-protein kinase
MHPTQLGPYSISTLLGRGGMGAVYEAVDQGNGRTVAVKTLATHLGDDLGLRKRFACEIETLLSLRHPCIVELISFGEEDGQPYFAMELVRGRSLEQLLRSGRTYTWRETVDVALAITRALKSAHDHGVVHRDLKPANLLFPDEPSGDATVKLADFGIARLFGSTGHTMSGMIIGTAEYMAPEQAAGAAVDHRVDLYALGLVMFAMLAGRPPFHGGHAASLLRGSHPALPTCPRNSTT